MSEEKIEPKVQTETTETVKPEEVVPTVEDKVEQPKEDAKTETEKPAKVESDTKEVVSDDEVDKLNKEVDSNEQKEEKKAYVPRSEFEKLQTEFVEQQKVWLEKVAAMEASLDDRFIAKGQRKSYAPTQPQAPTINDGESVVAVEPAKPEDQFKDLSNEEKFALFEKYSLGRR